MNDFIDTRDLLAQRGALLARLQAAEEAASQVRPFKDSLAKIQNALAALGYVDQGLEDNP